MTWLIGAHTDVGRQRTRNEDAGRVVTHGPDDHTLIVCDGMGGHEDGHVASAVGIAAIAEHMAQHAPDPEVFRVLHEALRNADAAVVAEAQGRTMGSTAVVARVTGPRCWYGWVGDSRLYLYRQGQLIERSEDHTRVAAMVAAGQLTPEQAHHHPDAHMLTQALGTGTAQPTVYAAPVDLEPGDLLVLCSDGLHDLVEPEEIPGLVSGLPAEHAAHELVALANERGGHDNITVIVGRWSIERPTMQEEPASALPGGAPPGATPPAAALPAPLSAATELPPTPEARSSRLLPLALAALGGAVVGSLLTAWWMGRGTTSP